MVPPSVCAPPAPTLTKVFPGERGLEVDKMTLRGLVDMFVRYYIPCTCLLATVGGGFEVSLNPASATQ